MYIAQLFYEKHIKIIDIEYNKFSIFIHLIIYE